MPRRIGNTLVPRNPVARAATTRRGGAHQQGQTAARQQSRATTRNLTENWREDVAFENEVKISRSEDDKL